MSQKYYLFVDYSGSTGGQEFYWTNVQNIYNALVNTYNEKNIIIMLWDDKAVLCNTVNFLKQINSRRGNGGTDPSVFASSSYMPENCHAVIITDGQVDNSKVSRCDLIVRERHFASVYVYFIDTGGAMNLSVSMPFTRDCDDVQIFIQTPKEPRKTLITGSTNVVIDLKKYYGNPELFLDQCLRIRGIIILQNMGKALNVSLRDSLLLLQKNLMQTIAQRASNGTGWNELRDILRVDYSEGVKQCQNIIKSVDTSIGKQVETAIADLLTQCSGSNNFSFENLEPGRLRRADIQAPDNNLPPQQELEHTFECPISFDDDNMALLIEEGPPILANVSSQFIESLMTNPLLLLTDNKLVEALINRLGHVIGCHAMSQIFAQGDPKSPFTRKGITSALIPLVPDDPIIRNQYIKSNTYALANLFFGNKLAGDPGLWLGVVYLAVLRSPRLADDTNFIAAFQNFLTKFWRLHNTNMTLSGLPVAPMMKAPMDIAIWFCVASPDIMLYPYQNLNQEDDATNRLRSFGSTAKYLCQLLDLTNYKYDRDWTINRLRLYKAFSWMMLQDKNPESDWRNRIRAQWQNHHVFPSGKIVLLDGNVYKSLNKLKLPKPLEKVPLGIILALMQLVDKSHVTP